MRIAFILLSLFFLSVAPTFSQQTGTPAERLAIKMADKMKDSLDLSVVQRAGVYNINMQLHIKKMEARRIYTDRGMLGTVMQQIENTRDSLYREVLTDDKFLLYRQKKRSLISAQ
jgi:hypothetical protein